MTPARERWSDERVAAAFAARARRRGPPPANLADAAVRHVVETARRPRARFRWNVRLAATVVAAVIVVTTVGITRLGVTAPASVPPSASTAAFASTAATTPSPNASPVQGTLERVDVAEALRIRDAFHDGRELAVSGFLLANDAVRLACALMRSTDRNPTRLRCGGMFVWLTQNPSSVADGTVVTSPSGPALRPSFSLVGPIVVRPGSNGSTPVVLVGHFDDRRARLCSEIGDGAECRDTFLVDRVEAVDGTNQPVATFDRVVPSGIEPIASTADVDGIVAAASDGQPVLSRMIVAGAAIGSTEPALRSHPQYNAARAIWVVTTLDTSEAVARVQTWLVVDGTSTVGRMTEDNQVSLAIPTSRPDQTVLCGRLDLDRCAAAIALVRSLDPSRVDTAAFVAVDDACPPSAACDRRYPFDSLVVLPSTTNVGVLWDAYEVVGLAQEPEEVMPYAGPLPPHILALLGSAGTAPTAPRAVQSPGAS